MAILDERLDRRGFLRGLSAVIPAAVIQTGPPVSDAANADEVVEQHRGDERSRPETLRFDSRLVEELITGQQKASFAKYHAELPGDVIAAAKELVGFSRETHEQEISTLLALFKLPFRDATGAPVPFCAAGISFVAAKAYATLLGAKGPALESLDTFRSLLPDLDHYYFYPSPSVQDMYHIAIGRRRLRPAKLKGVNNVPKRGWIVIFQFGNAPDHCGIVTSASSKVVQTIEFNTSGTVNGSQRDGGVVAARERTYNSIKGFIDTTKRPAEPLRPAV